MKKIFVVDWCMLFTFITTTATGFGMHIAGHNAEHWIWEMWAVIHSLAGISFVIVSIMHIQTHIGWYKGWIKNGLGNKSRVTIILSLLFIIALLSGIVLLGINGINTHVGLLHYMIGIVLTIIGMGHFVKRFSILCKSLK